MNVAACVRKTDERSARDGSVRGQMIPARHRGLKNRIRIKWLYANHTKEELGAGEGAPIPLRVFSRRLAAEDGAAIDIEDFAGEVTGEVGGEKENRSGDIFRRGDAP